MASTTAKIFRGENGQNYPFQIVSESGVAEILTLYNVAESRIEIKDPEDLDTIVLTLTSTDFTFSTPNVIWIPTDAHTALLPKINYVCFVHLINVTTSLETISKHFLTIEKS
jgi:hypothetical protein